MNEQKQEKKKERKKRKMTSHYDIIHLLFQISHSAKWIWVKKKSNNKNKKTKSGWVFVSGFFFFYLCPFFFVFFCVCIFSNTVTMQKCKKTTRYFNRFKSHNIKRLRVCS